MALKGKVERDKHNLTSQVVWQQKGGTYWVRYVHVEIVGFVNPNATKNSKSSLVGVRVGDRVRVKPSVATPKYKWGSVTHRSIGVVIGISCAMLYFEQKTSFNS